MIIITKKRKEECNQICTIQTLDQQYEFAIKTTYHYTVYIYQSIYILSTCCIPIQYIYFLTFSTYYNNCCVLGSIQMCRKLRWHTFKDVTEFTFNAFYVSPLRDLCFVGSLKALASSSVVCVHLIT